LNRENIKLIVVLFLVLFIALFPRVYNLSYFHDVDTDEAIYAQTMFTLTKGELPYKDVFLAHPPVYFYLAFPIIAISPSIEAIRFLNVLLSLGIVCTIFYLCKLWYSKKAAIIGSMIFALYPFAIYTSKLGLIENAMNLFIMVAICLLAKYFAKKNIAYLISSGFFMGISIMTKYTSLFILMAVILFCVLRMEKKKDLLVLLIGSSLFPIGILVLLLMNGSWSYFYTQTFYWQSIRFGMYPFEKLWTLTHGLGLLLPLFLVAAFRLVHSLGKGNDELMVYWLLISMVIIPFQKTVFLQYFIPLIIPLCVLAAGTLDRYFSNKSFCSLLPWKISFKTIQRKVMIFFVASVILFNFWSLMTLSYGGDWLMLQSSFSNEQQRILLENRIEIGTYVRNLTSTSDEIWTTDAAIAFFSRRIIVTPRSDYWKFQGFFQDVWGYGGTKEDYRGPIEGYPNGLISLQDIQFAWEQKRPKVIVISRSSQVDYLIWNGINNTYHAEEGLAGYIESNYHLGPIINGTGSTFYPLNVEVWVRN
jgi:4-amino-4-deoxy-L-arabinose transferase-like glycosyltransferase